MWAWCNGYHNGLLNHLSRKGYTSSILVAHAKRGNMKQVNEIPTNPYKSVDWGKNCLKSLYADKDFYVEVYDTRYDTPTGFEGHKEWCFVCRVFEGQGYQDRVDLIRCSLIGRLYEIVPIPQQFMYEQLQMVL